MIKQIFDRLFQEEDRFSVEEHLNAVRERNEERVKAAIEALGDKWVGHPNNAINKVEPK
jgi:hypothetical protein